MPAAFERDQPLRFVLGALIVLAVACGRRDETAARRAARPDTAPAVAGSQCGGGGAPAVVTPGGVGPVKLGARLAEVRRRCQVRDTSWASEGITEAGYVVDVGGHPVVALTGRTRDTSIARILVTDSALRTERGIGAGSTVGAVRRAYGALCGTEGEGAILVGAGSLPGVSFATDLDASRLAPAELRRLDRDPSVVPDTARVTRLWLYDAQALCGGS